MKLKTKNSKFPFVFANFAMTADGKIAFEDHTFTPFGSRRDQEHMMELRATADAVMSGARTLDLNPATLGTGGAKYRRLRLKRGLREYNLRIIVSGSGSIDPDAEIFKRKFSTSDTLSPPNGERAGVRGASVDREKAKLQPSPIILLTTARVPPAKLRQLRALVDEVKICGRTELNFRFAFRWLRRKWGVRRLLCEGGGALNGTLFHADLVDELHLTLCPKIFGGRNAPTLADGPGVLKLADATQLQLKSFKRVGDELFLIYRRVPGG